MRNAAVLLGLTLGTVLILETGADEMTKREARAEVFEGRVCQDVKLGYWLQLPAGHGAPDTGPWPLIVFLHGAGERGDDLNIIRDLGPLALARDNDDFPFIVLAPQCPSNQAWSSHAVVGLLDHILAQHDVDPARVYLTGYSMGGMGTWDTAMDYPERFAAIAPLCGRAVPLMSFRLWTTPIWVLHGEDDEVVPFFHSEEMVNVLRNMGHEHTKFTALPGVGHDIWTDTYADPALYDWFLEHQRR